ncbi:MAG TPA: lysylphosphatidylglycerol synthase transmembrane domain-containing protein, partial [Anaerolineae bacterium]|nr:lysylphosphatidylglycerol synthase transmembrane domain-containing protein [Anaerolineae bacterium]
MKRWQFWLGVVVSAFFVWLALRGLKLEEVLADLRAANYTWLIPGVAVYFVGVGVRTWRWHYLLKPLKDVPVRQLFPVVVIGYMGNNIYPARAGELLRAYVLRRNEGVSVSASLATVIVERIFDGLVMLLFVFVALPTAPFLPDALRSIVVFGSLLFFGALIVFLFFAAQPALAARVYNPLIDRVLPRRFRDPARGFIDRFITGLAALRDLRHIVMVFFTSILIWLLETVKYWFVMHAFNFEVSFFT